MEVYGERSKCGMPGGQRQGQSGHLSFQFVEWGDQLSQGKGGIDPPSSHPMEARTECVKNLRFPTVLSPGTCVDK